MDVGGLTQKMRISGLASGLDTDQIVKDLMRAERSKMDAVKQKMNLTQWKQEDYRGIIKKINEFQAEYMDVLKPASNLLNSASYKKFQTSVIDNEGAASSAVSALATADAVAGSYSVEVERLAVSAAEHSTAGISKALQSGDIRGGLVLDGKKVRLTLDGVTKEIAFQANYNIASQEDGDAFAAGFSALINQAFGVGLEDPENPGTYFPKVGIGYDHSSGKLTFSTDTGGGAHKLVLTSGSTGDGLQDMFITSGTGNRINTALTLSTLKDQFAVAGGLTFGQIDGVDVMKFSINGKEFTFSSNTTFNSMMNTINSDTQANVTMSYNETTDRISITAKQAGSGRNILIDNSLGNFFGEAGVSFIEPYAENFGTSGVDAVVKVNGQRMVRSSNTFTDLGITFTLNRAELGNTLNVKLTQDIEAVYKNIEGFINRYNEIIETINTKLNEKYDRDYPPLTDEQRKVMKEDDIKKWEERAKTGLLRSDPVLMRLTAAIRRALMDPVKGMTSVLADVGISSNAYTNKGKLSIQESKLKEAIAQDPDKVMNLFSKVSTDVPSYSRTLTTEQQQTRYEQSGLLQRLKDLLMNHVSILRNNNGKKGLLLEIAGISGDTTEIGNSLTLEINRYKKSIDVWMDKLAKKEDQYYRKFALMEKAISRMNSQANWLSSQLNTGGGR